MDKAIRAQLLRARFKARGGQTSLPPNYRAPGLARAKLGPLEPKPKKRAMVPTQSRKHLYTYDLFGLASIAPPAKWIEEPDNRPKEGPKIKRRQEVPVLVRIAGKWGRKLPKIIFEQSRK